MDFAVLPDRVRRAIERFEKERMINKKKRGPKFGRMRRNGVKVTLKKEHLRDVRNEYGNI